MLMNNCKSGNSAKRMAKCRALDPIKAKQLNRINAQAARDRKKYKERSKRFQFVTINPASYAE